MLEESTRKLPGIPTTKWPRHANTISVCNGQNWIQNQQHVCKLLGIFHFNYEMEIPLLLLAKTKYKILILWNTKISLWASLCKLQKVKETVWKVIPVHSAWPFSWVVKTKSSKYIFLMGKIAFIISVSRKKQNTRRILFVCSFVQICSHSMAYMRELGRARPEIFECRWLSPFTRV